MRARSLAAQNAAPDILSRGREQIVMQQAHFTSDFADRLASYTSRTAWCMKRQGKRYANQLCVCHLKIDVLKRTFVSQKKDLLRRKGITKSQCTSIKSIGAQNALLMSAYQAYASKNLVLPLNKKSTLVQQNHIEVQKPGVLAGARFKCNGSEHAAL